MGLSFLSTTSEKESNISACRVAKDLLGLSSTPSSIYYYIVHVVNCFFLAYCQLSEIVLIFALF